MIPEDSVDPEGVPEAVAVHEEEEVVEALGWSWSPTGFPECS